MPPPSVAAFSVAVQFTNSAPNTPPPWVAELLSIRQLTKRPPNTPPPRALAVFAAMNELLITAVPAAHTPPPFRSSDAPASSVAPLVMVKPASTAPAPK